MGKREAREKLRNKECGRKKKPVNVVCLCVFVPVCVSVHAQRQTASGSGG